jgi:phage shock protein PspC (stress-responsive transcriptional regulator)
MMEQPTLPPSGTETQTATAGVTESIWVRSKDGVFAGVCATVAKRLGVDAWVVRTIWLLSVLFMGTGLLVYLTIAVSLPREDDPERGYGAKIFGVCSRLAVRSKQEPGLIRLLAVLLIFASCGTALLAYVILALVLPKANKAS